MQFFKLVPHQVHRFLGILFAGLSSVRTFPRVLNFGLQGLYCILVTLRNLHCLRHSSGGRCNFILHLPNSILFLDQLLAQILTGNQELLKIFR
uniref:Putative secreted protein n=1 Tax=Anopheles marajoara TaxID=58244 RepID=A0A2M4C9J5_9DIPT